MEKQINEAIEQLTAKAKVQQKPDEAMKFTQAALNLAHAKSVLASIPKEKTKGTGS